VDKGYETVEGNDEPLLEHKPRSVEITAGPILLLLLPTIIPAHSVIPVHRRSCPSPSFLDPVINASSIISALHHSWLPSFLPLSVIADPLGHTSGPNLTIHHWP
ncbi:hypothetical protein Pmani_039920, partial [Petrolisthes manimaculis]